MVRRWLARGSGVAIIIAALLSAFFSWLALHFLAPIAADPPYPAAEIPAFVRGCVEHRGLVPLLALPALLCGALLVRAGRRSIALLVLGSLALAVPFVVVIACFLAIVGPMYSYRELGFSWARTL